MFGSRPVRIAGVVIFTVLSAARCNGSDDLRPVAAYLALPPPGSEPPLFSFPTPTLADTLTPTAVRGTPTVLALWSTTCSASRLAYEGIESLAEEYGGDLVDVVIVADDGADRLREFADSAKPRSILAAADGRLMETFERAAPATDEYRVKFALPSFLILDSAGTVAARHAGVSFRPRERFEWARAALDSLLTTDADSASGAP